MAENNTLKISNKKESFEKEEIKPDIDLNSIDDNSTLFKDKKNLKSGESLQNQSKLKRKYNFQRAAVACIHCRKAKTRCNYVSIGTTCFRCDNLSLNCSLVENSVSNHELVAKLKAKDAVEQENQERKRSKIKHLLSMNSTLNEKSNNSISNESNSSLSKSDSLSSRSVTSVSPPNEAPNSKDDYLFSINEKLDKLSEMLTSLVGKNDSFKSNNLNEKDFTPLPSLGNNPSLSTSSETMNSLPLLHLPPPQKFQTNLPSLNKNIPSILSSNILAPLARPSLQSGKLYQPNEYQIPTNLNNNNNININNNNIPGNFANNFTNNNLHENDEFFFLNAPYLDITNIANNLGLPFSKEIGFDIVKNNNLSSIQELYDLISRKLIDYETCIDLVEIALMHYGKWISYVEVDFKLWFDKIRLSSPLLFCLLVLLGLRHKKSLNLNRPNLDLDILQSLHQLLSLTIYEVPQSKEFIQASILLSHFSSSLSYKHIYFDSWWISSYGLIHFMTREMNMNLLVKNIKSPEKIHQYRLWNHLTISHLINCILSGRPCIIDEIRLDQCRDILELPEASSFDAVIVSQLCLTLSLYNSLQFPENVDVSLKELDSTYEDWKYLSENVTFTASVTGFYHFAKTLILRRYLLKNIFAKREPEFSQRCRQFFTNAVKFSEFCEYNEDMVDDTDLIKQCFFLCVFMILQFKQLNLFTEPNDNFIIVECVDRFLKFEKNLSKKVFYYSNYTANYCELFVRMRNAIFSPV